MLRIRVFCVCCIMLSLCAVYVCAQMVSNGIQRVEAASVPVIRLEEEDQRSLPDLWEKYKASPNPQYKRVIGALMTHRSNAAVTSELDDEICEAFVEQPTDEMALLLGMCNSTRSHDLLKRNSVSEDPKLAEACRLALARRGDKHAEDSFIDSYRQQSMKRIGVTDREHGVQQMSAVNKLEYIGSLEAILAVFDSVGSQEMGSHNDIVVSRNTMENMRAFLSVIGVSVPPDLNEKELAQWWKQNRAAVKQTLRDTDDLPHLKKSRIIKTIH